MGGFKGLHRACCVALWSLSLLCAQTSAQQAPTATQSSTSASTPLTKEEQDAAQQIVNTQTTTDKPSKPVKNKTSQTDNSGKSKTLLAKQAERNQAPLKLAKIDVTGVADELKKNIELHMPVTIPECTAERGDVKLFFTAVKKNLRKATRALGYYDAEFTSGGKIINKCWNLTLKIKPGKPTRVVSQAIKVIGAGKNEPVFKKILKDLPYKIGDPLNHQLYTDFKTKLSEASQTLGYFDAEFEKRSIRVNPTTYQAQIALVLNTGTRYRYGEVTVKQSTLSKKAVDKYIKIKPGQWFKGEDLIVQQQILQRSGYYKTIKIEVLHDLMSNHRVPISIQLIPKKRNAYKFKVGYGSDTGARTSIELNRRWTGVKGRKLLAKAQFAQTISGVSLQLVNPRENPEDNSLVYNFDWEKSSNDTVVGRKFDLGAKLIRKRPSGWIQSASINALKTRTRVQGENEVNSDLLVFGVGLEKVSADSLIFPTNGWRVRLGLKTASEALLSDQNVFQTTAQVKRIMPLGDGRLLARAHIGSTVVHDFENLPKSLRFFAGGGNSVRGYDFESLGVLNSKGVNRGGKHLVDLSLEYQHPIQDGWSAAVFVDTGNAFDDVKNADLKVGVGVGARWRSPVGPVRIDLGFPKDNYRRPKLYLSVGSDL